MRGSRIDYYYTEVRLMASLIAELQSEGAQFGVEFNESTRTYTLIIKS